LVVETAVAATSTVIVIGGYVAPGASTSVRVHDTVVVPPHVQPLPPAAVAVRPAGIRSVTVTVLPSVGFRLTFVTVSVSVLPTCPGAKVAGLCVAAILIGDSVNTYGSGGVPGRTRKL
jgi:hypothetical protein